MENKETSIEWLMGQALGWVKDKNNGNDHIVFPKGAIQQAKAMHKEEIIKAHFDAQEFNAMMLHSAEEYYKSVFEKIIKHTEVTNENLHRNN